MTSSLVRPTAIRLRDVRFERRGAGLDLAVDRFELSAGSAVAVVGPSGVGKSTLLEGLLGVPRTRGEVTRQVGAHGAFEVANATWLPQDAAAAFEPITPLGTQLLRASRSRSHAEVRDALRRFDVPHAERVLASVPSAVSGGELRRVLLVLAGLRADPLLLIDEPTEGLDRPRIEQACAALRILVDAEHHPAALVVTHSAQVARTLATRTYRIDAGRLVEGVPGSGPDWSRIGHEGGLRNASHDGAALLSARAVSIGRGRVALAERLALELREGETVALLGPSGVGKSSLARVLCGLDVPRVGQVERLVGERAVQLVPQDAVGSLTPGRAVGLQIAEVAATGFDVARRAADLGLAPELLERPVAALSGGEARRVATLRALAARPRLLILDEPTAHLDPRSAERVVRLLRERAEDLPSTQLWITHDDDLAAACADRIVRLEPDGDRAVLETSA